MSYPYHLRREVFLYFSTNVIIVQKDEHQVSDICKHTRATEFRHMKKIIIIRVDTYMMVFLDDDTS